MAEQLSGNMTIGATKNWSLIERPERVRGHSDERPTKALAVDMCARLCAVCELTDFHNGLCMNLLPSLL